MSGQYDIRYIAGDIIDQCWARVRMYLQEVREGMHANIAWDQRCSACLAVCSAYKNVNLCLCATCNKFAVVGCKSTLTLTLTQMHRLLHRHRSNAYKVAVYLRITNIAEYKLKDGHCCSICNSRSCVGTYNWKRPRMHNRATGYLWSRDMCARCHEIISNDADVILEHATGLILLVPLITGIHADVRAPILSIVYELLRADAIVAINPCVSNNAI